MHILSPTLCVYIVSSFILALLLIFMTHTHSLSLFFSQPNATKCWYEYVQINASDHLRLLDNGNGNSPCDSGEFSLLSHLLAHSPSAHCLQVHLSCERIMRLCLLLAIIIICERKLFIYLCALFTISLSAKKYLSSNKCTQIHSDAMYWFMYSITLFWSIFGLRSDFR